VLGGSNNTTCADGQNCSCHSGLFTCNCDCDTPYTIPTLPPPNTGTTGSGTAWKKNWDKLEEYLLTTKDPLAEDIAKNLNRVFNLQKTDYRQFYLEANFLEFQFYKLPQDIQNRALKVVE